MALQRADTPPEEHPRLHVDLIVDDAAEQAAEIERLVSLGATRVHGTRIQRILTSSSSLIRKEIASASWMPATVSAADVSSAGP